ncbi:TraE/TraK family type IV conjugative transfer system protein [Pantoea ananatis]
MKLRVKETRNRLTVALLGGLGGLLALSVAGNCITGGLAWHFYRTQKTITVPMMFDRAFSSTATGGDANLNSMLVRSLASLRLNVTPETVDSQYKRLLSWVPPEQRSEMKKTLAVESDYIKNNGISSVYSIEHEFTDTTTGEITVGGRLHASTTNGTLDLVTPDAHRVRAASGKDRIDLPDARKAYRFNLHYVDGLISLTDFSEVKWPAAFDADDSGKKS